MNQIDNDLAIQSALDAEAQAAVAEQQRQQSIQNKKKHITKWTDRIANVRKHDKFYFTRWAEDRKSVRGETDEAVSANLISAILDVLAAFLYAKNPDLNARPSESVDRVRLKEYREFAKTIEIIASRMLKDAGLKRKAKRWIRGAQTVGIGWLKVVMQTRTEKQPLMESRINDLQDQLAKIKSKQIRITLNQEQEGVLASEIESNITAAQAKSEITVAEGLVIDYVHPEEVLVATECGEIENYMEAPWIAFVSYKTEDQVLQITGWQSEEQVRYLKSATRWTKRPRNGEKGDSSDQQYVQSDETESEDGFYRLHEVWSLEDGVIYTLLEGCSEDWARKPYAPVTGRRFYPAFGLGFHYIDGDRYPQSDARQLKKLAEEYNETRSDFRIHRQRARPGVIFNETQIDPKDVKKVTDSKTQEYVGVNPLKQDADLNQLFVSKKYNPVDPGLYETGPILRDMEKVSGAQEALQSSVQIEKTATEAQIQEAGRGARTGARLDDLEDVLTDLCEYVIQVALLTMDQADAERYAGPNAVWMNLTTDQALTLFEIEIKAGSTGKPKTRSDRDAWGTLLPLVQDLVMKIGDARMKGMEWAAKPMIALLNETFERMDDHADIEMFLPVVPPEAIQAGNKPDPLVESEIELNEASATDKMASAVQKVPALVFSPAMRQLLGMDEGQETDMDDLKNALQGPQQPQVPAPSPI